MDVVHPKASIKKLHHYDKHEHQPPHANFYAFDGDRELTPTSSYKANAEIPHRFQVNDLKVDVEKLLHGSDASP